MAGDDVGGVFVAVAGEFAGAGVVAGGDVGAGGGDAQDGLGDGELLHELEVGLFAPLLYGGVSTSVGAVTGGREVLIDTGIAGIPSGLP